MGILEGQKTQPQERQESRQLCDMLFSHFQLSPSQQILALYITSFIFLANWLFLTIQSPNMHDLPGSATITNFLLGIFT